MLGKVNYITCSETIKINQKFVSNKKAYHNCYITNMQLYY